MDGTSDCRVADNCTFGQRALNVALLVPEAQRKLPGVLLKTLSAHYSSPGRLAKYKRQFERMTLAIELETLARKAFIDVDASVRLQLVRDRFIIGQENRALRRNLDSVGPDTPISDIVDRCRVWESHDESNSGPITRHEPTGPRGVLHNGSTMNIARWQQNRAQPRRNTKYWPNGCVRWHNSRCREILTR